MSDPDTERGWQNVLREIRRHVRTFTVRPYEQPLSPVEEAEYQAWLAAYKAVLKRIAAMDGGDDGN